MYEYKMVQIPRDVIINAGTEETFASTILQKIVHNNAKEGWEFYRVDYLNFHVQVSVISGIVQQNDDLSTVGVVSFRREKPKA